MLKVNGHHMTYGATLARQMPPEQVRAHIESKADATLGIAAVALTRSPVPGRIDAECYLDEVSPEEAVLALRIAANRLEVVHHIIPTPPPNISEPNVMAAIYIAEKLVDMCRSSRVMSPDGGLHSFDVTRQRCVDTVAHALTRGLK